MLKRILETKRQEIQTMILPEDKGLEQRSFYEALKTPNRSLGLIAEVKKASPSKGVIKENFNPKNISIAYEKGLADCLSVLTDETYFQGKKEYLTLIKETINLPILRKDFIIDSIQIEESKRIGADAILLIAEAMEPSLLRELYEHATELGLDALVEVHSVPILEKVLREFTPKLLGVNNRNLSTFETNIHQLKDFRKIVPENTLLVSESGIYTVEDLQIVREYGAHAILVGESLMRKENQQLAIEELFGENIHV
ncbi:indole-3-glycerol phosphate synthase TrpC [Metabacillus herbersteinensis]|uniref:Indole-3-glycerol phosphate synthase n=1 Tax=Metabacillus herbersteinensis TaxID=283816 RepID=A0ABV6GD51_9BACI